MQAVILAGGLGTRLRPLTYTRPKALVPLLNRPMILHLLGLLPEAVDRVVVAASFMVEALEAFFDAHPVDRAVTIVQEEEPLGTGGALKNVEGHLDGTFLALNGDVVTSLDLQALLAYHRTKGGVGTLALWEVEDPRAYGVVGVDGEGRVERFQEKPTPEEAVSRLANAGVYVLEPAVLDLIPTGRPVSLERETFPRAVEEGLYGMPFEGYWSDAGTLESYLAATRMLLGAQGGHLDESALVDREAGILDPIAVGAGTLLEGGIVGPFVSVGRRCRVTGAKLSNAVLLDGVTVGEGALVEESLVGAEVTIGPDCRLQGCIVGDGAVTEKGAKLVGVRVTR